jgi:hypothetical protein
MTEAEWLTSSRADPLLSYLGEILPEAVANRKIRLFACACVREKWSFLNEPLRTAVAVAERYADHAATLDEVHRAFHGAWGKAPSRSLHLASGVAATEPFQVMRASRVVPSSVRCPLLRDIVGNPFRPLPAIESQWLVWNSECVRRMAQTIYGERRFPDVPVLADALEEAGCVEETILAHCRGPGPHVRGCWVVDLILGKE